MIVVADLKATLASALKRIAWRFRLERLARGLTGVWLAALVGYLVVLLFAPHWILPRTQFLFAGLVAAAAAVVALACLFGRINLHWVAQQIERAHPELATKLLAAYEQERTTPPHRRSFLGDEVIHEARIHALTHHRWNETVPTGRLRRWGLIQAMAFCALVAVVLWPRSQSPSSLVAAGTEPVDTSTTTSPLEVTIEPGDVELERGSDLLVLARFPSAAQLPREATLHVGGAVFNRQYSLSQSLSDPIFAGRVPEVRDDLTYRVAFGKQTTRDYRVTVFDYPEVERIDAEIHYPSYAGLPVRRIEDVRFLSVLEGSEVRLSVRLNKPVAEAKLAIEEAEPLRLAKQDGDAAVYSLSHVVTQNIRGRIELVDDKGRKNRQTAEVVITAAPNRPPELKLKFPRNDVAVSPLQEIPLEAETMDDFGVVRWGLAFELTGKTTQNVTLGEKLPAQERRGGSHLLALEDLKAAPDELLAWHAWAEDLGPDGKVRRTTSDIFFAEVNPFEEIFREGNGAPGTPGPQQTAADEAAKLQKEIISATWNLRRRETGAKPSPAYASDAQVIADSQQKAIEALQTMKEKLRAADAAQTVAEIEAQMQTAVRELSAAVAANSLDPLAAALAAEQAAYQGLLKLRARESRVSRSRNSRGAAGGESANRQKLNELELSEEQNLYETRSAAQDPQATPAQREREEFLKRLRELARRQEDMNEKIKELQAALEAAKDEEAKKEIERQLKRLRDEQRDMLRDVDQLQNKLDQPEHNQPMNEASKQLAETREQVRQASDALEKGETAQALNAGTRAENQLDKLREDFRKQTSGQFGEEVRNLLDKAEQLDKRQQEIGQELAGDNPKEAKPGDDKPTRGLRSPSKPAESQLAEQLDRQQKELSEVLEQAKQITERAEGNEPLLSKQLYDAVREAHQKQTTRAVDMLRRLVENGLNAEAAQVEPQARAGVRQLRDKIEKAAQGVLGDDIESLRRAKRDIDQLAQALAQELARENPTAANRAAAARGENGKQDDAQPNATGPGAKPGEQSGEHSEEGKPTEKKPSEGNSSEGKPGEAKSPDGKPMPGQSAGDKPGEQPGQGKPSNDGKPGEGKPAEGKPSEGKPGEGEGTKPGQGKSPSESGGKGSESSGESQSPGSQASGANRPAGLRGRPQPSSERNAQDAPNVPGDQTQPGDRTPTSQQIGTGGGAFEGNNWREWSDALRNVEEFVPGTRLRTEAARVREQAQALRAESKRHSKPPNWDLVREQVYEPLVELQQQLDEELLRRASPDAAVPLDRDPVPERFGEAVRKYYERLGSGQ